MFTNFKFSLFAVCLVSLLSVNAYAGGGKAGGKNNVDVANGNSLDDENGDIQVWLLSEDVEVPTTKAEAEALGGVVLAAGPFSTIRFTEEDGNYLLIAADKAVYESLPGDTPISPGTEVAAKAVELRGGVTVGFTISNDPDGGPPVIEDGIQPPSGPSASGSGSTEL